MKRHNFYTLWTAFFTLVFVIALSINAMADDKHKSASTPTKPASSSSGSASHGGNSGHSSGGTGSGRPSGGGTMSGHPSSGAGSGRPSGGNSSKYGAGNYTAGKNNTGGSNGRPGSYNGKPTVSNGGNNGRPSGNNGKGSDSGKFGSGKTGPGSSGHTEHASSGDSKYGHKDSHESGKDVRTAHSSEHEHDARHEVVRHESQVGNHRVFKDQRGDVRRVDTRDRHGNSMAIHRDYRGGSRFVTRRPGGGRIVGYGRGRGFSERAYLRRGGRVYVQRTYIYGGRRYAYAYRSYYYHGVAFYSYAPAFYYRPVFYGWAFSPWAAPVYFHWGWYGDPWYASYGYYYQPYPVYPSASLWLTDYLLAESLRASYEARANAAAADAAAYSSQNDAPVQQGGEASLSPEVKQLIADEVQRQLAAERAAAAQPAPPNQASADGNNQMPEETPSALDPNQRVFVVANNVDLVGDSGECAVTAGDVLIRSGEPNGSKIGVNVVSSKKGDCAVGTNSDIEISELQEMHNQFREKMDSGLKTLAENQGKNGLPKAPDTSTTAGEVPAPQPDADADAQLQDQQKDAEKAENEIQKAPGGGY